MLSPSRTIIFTPTAGSIASLAKAFVADAFVRTASESIQIHGGIGFTWECDAQLFYKRGRYGRNVLGSTERHFERVLTSQGL